MARPKKSKKVNYSPKVSYFKPVYVGFKEHGDVVMNLEEIEALRLVDVKGLSQNNAAQSMLISQPTFSRTLNSARKKSAEAIVLGKAIKVRGGNVLIKLPSFLEGLRKNN